MCKANHSICYVELYMYTQEQVTQSLIPDSGNGYEAQYMRNIKPHKQVMDMKLSTGNGVLYHM